MTSRPLARAAERVWRVPLLAAAVAYALCGPAQALGHSALVEPVALLAVALTAASVPLGLLALRAPAPTPTPTHDQEDR